MPEVSRFSSLAMLSVFLGAAAAACGAANLARAAVADDTQQPQAAQQSQVAQRREPQRLVPTSNPHLDRSGRERVGKASFYAKMFDGRKMADGTPMSPHGNNAASKTLPLGTTAKVTNLETGKSAVVTIRDRGPYVAGRIVDLSPATAQKIGLSKSQGVVPVAVAPIVVPLADGKVKLGAAVATPTEFAASTKDEVASRGPAQAAPSSLSFAWTLARNAQRSR